MGTIKEKNEKTKQNEIIENQRTQKDQSLEKPKYRWNLEMQA